MPYITADEREQLKSGKSAATPGQLNYVITRLLIERPLNSLKFAIIEEILDYLGGKQSYTLFNEVMGVLECARREFRRRRFFDAGIDGTFEILEEEFYSQYIAPYEDKKLEQNGDVY